MKASRLNFSSKYISKHSAFVCNKDIIICEQLRTLLSLVSPIILPDGKKVMFINKLSYFDTTLYIDGTPPTIEQLNQITNELKICGQFLCPMLVWATKEGVPTLVKLKPGSNNPVKVVKTPSLYSLGYSIWIVPTKTQD